MRLYRTLLDILSRMRIAHRFVFTVPPVSYVMNQGELNLGPHENPHTYASLKEMAFYQADEITSGGHQVWLLFPVPREEYQKIMEDALDEHFPD